MNLFQKYFILAESTAESRYYHSKGLEPPEKLSEYEILEKYKDDSNIHISFRDLKKIGINPKSFHKTPNGIYSYPLSLIWKNFNHLDKRLEIPFAGPKPYMYIFKPKNINKGLFLKEYDENNFKIDIQKIRNSKLFDDKLIDFLINASHENAFVKTWGGKLWFITWGLTYKKDIYNIKSFKKYHNDSENNVNLWNRLLYKILEYDYVVDDDQGIIHNREPIQAVFFSSSVIDVIDIIDSKLSKGFIYKSKVSDDAIYKYMSDEFPNDWALWQSGDWYDGVWINGEWTEGNWYKGHWRKGHWYDGTWHGGTWHGGTWHGGYDKNGDFHPKGDSPDKWNK